MSIVARPTLAAGLRVLMTADASGRVFTYAASAAKELTRRGVNVHIALMGPRMHVVRRGLIASSAVVAPTLAMLRALERHYIRLPHGRVVAGGIVPDDVTGARRVPKRRSVLAVGRAWDRAENLEGLARVAPIFPGPVRVAGETRRPDGSTQRLRNVEQLGWLDATALSLEMDAAAVFAHPARYEPFGVAALEAANRGCALVLGDLPSVREVWEDAALFVSTDDDVGLATAIELLGLDEDFRLECARRARERAVTFTVERTIDRMLAVYTSALGSKPGFAYVADDPDVLGAAPISALRPTCA